MGLDMTLTVHLGSQTRTSSHIGQGNKITIKWKQANQIHGWFVKHIQDNKDNYKRYMVKRRQIRSLISICESVLQTPSKAEELLPSYQGFFFGTYGYDKNYFDQIRDTIDKLSMVIRETEGTHCSIYYEGRW